MNDTIVKLSESDFHPREKKRLLYVDINDLLEELEDDIRDVGEVPSHLGQTKGLDAFLDSLYTQIAYLPYGDNGLRDRLRSLFHMYGQFFDEPYLTTQQKEAWVKFADQLSMRFEQMKLYQNDSHGREHLYDYYMLRGDVLILQLHE